MIASCPNCATNFTVSETNLGVTGRKVKCSRCGHVWLQRGDGSTAPAPPPAPRPAAAEPPPAAPDATPATAAPAPPAAASAPRPATGEAAESEAAQAESAKAEAADMAIPANDDRAERSSATTRRRRGGRAVAALIALLLVFGALGLGTYVWRGGDVAKLPALGTVLSLFGLDHAPGSTAKLADASVEGLGFENVTTTRHIDGAVQVLVIAGEVVNNAGAARAVPPLRGALLGSDNRELQHWTFTAKAERLDAGQRAGFETSLRAPSTEATDVKVTFTPPGG